MKNHLYGIPNCDSVRKARRWLDDNDVEYAFHDYKTEGVDRGQLEQLITAYGVDTIVNTRGTTYRNLSDEDKSKATDSNTAVALLVQHPSMIKRPVLDHLGGTLVGFKEDEWSAVLL